MRNRARIIWLEGLIDMMFQYRDQQVENENWHRIQKDINVLQESYREQTGRYYTFRKPRFRER